MCVIQECWLSEHIKIPLTPFRKGGFRGIFTNSRELHPTEMKVPVTGELKEKCNELSYLATLTFEAP